MMFQKLALKIELIIYLLPVYEENQRYIARILGI